MSCYVARTGALLGSSLMTAVLFQDDPEGSTKVLEDAVLAETKGSCEAHHPLPAVDAA